MDAVALPGDPVAAWLRFGLQRHGRVNIVGFHEPVKIDLDRVFVPLYVYADRARRGGGPTRQDKDGLGRGGAEFSLDEAGPAALARPEQGFLFLLDGHVRIGA